MNEEGRQIYMSLLKNIYCISCYRGIHHQDGFPCNSQQTQMLSIFMK